MTQLWQRPRPHGTRRPSSGYRRTRPRHWRGRRCSRPASCSRTPLGPSRRPRRSSRSRPSTRQSTTGPATRTRSSWRRRPSRRAPRRPTRRRRRRRWRCASRPRGRRARPTLRRRRPRRSCMRRRQTRMPPPQGSQLRTRRSGRRWPRRPRAANGRPRQTPPRWRTVMRSSRLWPLATLRCCSGRPQRTLRQRPGARRPRRRR
mmetsp:Transcript_100480/g.313151  ORF Transcript_100480/g.313151 Transcript_100480/m.313151 type:complete len:203 (-) Transcript_100480:1161-1769(-)